MDVRSRVRLSSVEMHDAGCCTVTVNDPDSGNGGNGDNGDNGDDNNGGNTTPPPTEEPGFNTALLIVGGLGAAGLFLRGQGWFP